MAKWPQTGSGIASLHERTPEFEAMVKFGLVDHRDAETTLVQVIAGLGLVPLSADDERMIRSELGVLIAAGYQNFADSAKFSPADRVTVAGVRKRLRRLADLLEAAPWDPADLDEIERFLRGRESGLRTIEEIAVAGKIMSVLVAQTESYDRAHAVLHDYRSNPRLVAEACHRAAKELGTVKGKRGAPSTDWSGLLCAAKLIAKRNRIRPTIVINRKTSEVEGRFIEIAEGLERLLPRFMRTRNRVALAKRLQRVKSK
jgi:hypothetical protein